jgi:hypothetical protein
MISIPRSPGLQSQDVFGQLRELDDKLAASDAAPQRAEPAEIVEARKHRGQLSTTFGMATRGVRDLERALESQPDNLELVALVAEAHRVYARDILLAGGLETRQGVVSHVQDHAITGFTRALQGTGLSEARRAWLHAHRGAAHTLVYTMKPDDERFERAAQDFVEARKLPGYVWALQFEAFLYAVRGGPGDYETARRLLRKIEGVDDLTQSSLHRSLSMLFRYDQTPEAARESVANGLEAVRRDPEDYTAAYFAAASLRTLRDRNEVSQELFEAALESARVRTMNAISQATAVLAAIGLLQNRPEVARTFLQRAVHSHYEELDVRLDLETMAMMSRDPTWEPLRREPEFQRLMDTGVTRPFGWWPAASKHRPARKE